MSIKNIFIVLFPLLLSACGSDKASVKINTQANPASSEALSKQLVERLESVEVDVESLMSQLTLAEKISLTHASGKFHVNAIERLGIPEMWLSDGPHGVRHQIQRDSWSSADWTDDHATYLPHLTSVAASWDPEVARLHGNVLGAEARHRGKDIILGPGVNLARLPLYGRNFEYMGEDPYLGAKLVVAEVKAIQSHDVSANVKHYALNNQELNRTGVNAKPDERTLREVYLPIFEAAVKEGGVYSLMGSYNEYYGTNANQSKHLVMDILKGEWGFDGVLLTDWNVDINTYDAAVNGLDLEMGTNVERYDDYFLAKPLQEMIENGKVPMSVLDDKVRRILRLQHRIGLYDVNRKSGTRNTKEHQLAARKIASQGVVLLKNETVGLSPVLPLEQNKIKHVLVLGPNANKKHGTGGGSSEVKSLYEITPLEGLKAQLGDDVKIQVMRAKSKVLTPIASDYVASRHWTGTAAWNISFFSDSTHEKLLSESWIVDSMFSAKNNANEQFISMKADITPLKSGLHQLKVSTVGSFELKINNKVVISHKASGQSNVISKLLTHDIQLQENTKYAFEINYQGNKTFTLGWDAPGNLFTDEAEYLAAAKKADAVIYFGGLSHADDRESIDRTSMKLPNSQDEIITKLVKANPKTVVFLVAGSAVEMPWAEQANAIVWGWYGGMEAGHAFSDVLFGDVNPSGKMPITLPNKLEDVAAIALNDYNAVESLYKEGVFIGYRWFEQQNIAPIFPFGHGLSYSQFTFSDISLSTQQVTQEQLDNNEPLTIAVTVTNSGSVDGAEVVQLYLHDKEASVERPLKELKGFKKVFLKAGESKTVTLTLGKRDLSFWDETIKNWQAESGDFKIFLGSSLTDIRLTTEFSYQ